MMWPVTSLLAHLWHPKRANQRQLPTNTVGHRARLDERAHDGFPAVGREVQSEIASAQRRIEERRPDREQVEVRRRQITAALRTGGPADELLRLRDELSEKDGG